MYTHILFYLICVLFVFDLRKFILFHFSTKGSNLTGSDKFDVEQDVTRISFVKPTNIVVLLLLLLIFFSLCFVLFIDNSFVHRVVRVWISHSRDRF